ncbi:MULTISPECIES: hypothetical protein [Maricaulis]|jgi:hypothetical protein|uniref:hypothetical protein n=1 Tax=Maricaulis TaxID=74317 RepID=UPI0003045C15|nr:MULTISPECIES: hypothetical protein [Maricaulis]MAC88264.1 hypothetical protein [Maricaulis sp.]
MPIQNGAEITYKGERGCIEKIIGDLAQVDFEYAQNVTIPLSKLTWVSDDCNLEFCQPGNADN